MVNGLPSKQIIWVRVPLSTIMNVNDNTHLNLITSLLQTSIKKGNKSKSEKAFRSMLFYLIKNNKDLDLINFFLSVQNNIQPAVKLQKKKFFYKPSYTTEWHKKNQAAAWILKELKKNKKSFSVGLAQELTNIVANTSPSIKHRQALYQTATQKIYIK